MPGSQNISFGEFKVNVARKSIVCREGKVYLQKWVSSGTRELGQVAWWDLSGKMQAKWGAHRLTGLISCLVFVPRLDHPYMVPTACVEMEIVP